MRWNCINPDLLILLKVGELLTPLLLPLSSAGLLVFHIFHLYLPNSLTSPFTSTCIFSSALALVSQGNVWVKTQRGKGRLRIHFLAALPPFTFTSVCCLQPPTSPSSFLVYHSVTSLLFSGIYLHLPKSPIWIVDSYSLPSCVCWNPSVAGCAGWILMEAQKKNSPRHTAASGRQKIGKRKAACI